MNPQNAKVTNDYRFAMGQLLMLYTQVDRLIMIFAPCGRTNARS